MKVSNKLLIVIVEFSIFSINNCEEDEGPIETKECRERDRLVASDKEDLYSLVDALAGQTLILRCRFCKEEHSSQPKNWFKIDQLGVTTPHEVKLDMYNDASQNRVTVNYKHSLIIRNLSAEDAGFYSCVRFEDKTNQEKFNYLIDMVFPEKSTSVEKGSITGWSRYHDDFFASVNKLFKESEGVEFVYLRDILHIDCEMATQWAPWGECQACGRPQGEAIMKKKGYCRIKLTPYGDRPENLTNDEIYLYKVPAIACRSRRLRSMFPHISNYTGGIPDFTLEDRCSAACNPDAEGVNKGWKVGTGKGFKYKKHSVMEENSHLTFVCPDSTLDNKVVWKKNGRSLRRGESSNPHVIVDTFDTLYLIEVTTADAGNYTCYVNDIRMQQIRVFVYSKSKFLSGELLRYMIYLGYILFLSSFCYCGGLVVTWQRRHLFKNYEELRQNDPKKKDEELENLV